METEEVNTYLYTDTAASAVNLKALVHSILFTLKSNTFVTAAAHVHMRAVSPETATCTLIQ